MSKNITGVLPHDVLSDEYVSGKIMNYIGNGIYEHKNYILGKVLTIIDASIPDQEQRKAIKDLVHEAFQSGSYLNDTGVRYMMASLSSFLKTLDKDDSSNETNEYERYVESQVFDQYSQSKKDFSICKLG